MDDFTIGFFKNNFLIFFLLLFASSCNVINPPEPIPSYLSIDTFDFYTTNVNQGSNANKIQDVWVYIDDNLQGIYSLPASVPILETGTHNLKLRPGIYFNGMKSSRFIYPFYSIYDSLVNFTEGNEIFVKPRSTYVPGLVFTNENFDSNGGIIFDSTSKSLTIMTVTTDQAEVFEGAGSGKVFLDSSHYKMEVATGYLTLPVLGNNRTIIEVNYKTSVSLNIGFYAKTSNVPGAIDEYLPILTLNKNDEWNKLYLEITNPLHAFASALSFRIYFTAQISDPNTTALVYIDNFKVIHN